MKGNAIDRMKNPFFAGLIFRIEQMICLTDNEAKEQGIVLTDSQIRSTLVKARKLVEGGDPKLPDATEREQILAFLAMQIYHAPDGFVEQEMDMEEYARSPELEISDWVKAIVSVEASIKVRSSSLPGSRSYLDFVHGFIAEAKGNK